MNNLVKIISYFYIKFVLLIFFLIPIIFSYLPDLFGIHNFFHSKFPYESIKVVTFLYIACFTLILLIARIFLKKSLLTANNFIYILLVTIFFSISTFFSLDIRFSIYGSPEKLHGLIFFISLLLLFFILIDFLNENKKNKYFLLKTIFIGFIFISLYGLIQFFGLDPLKKMFVTRVPIERVFSTLGNPNYLAGYALVLLPLSFIGFRNKGSIIFFTSIFFLIIILTRSLFGITFASLYLIYIVNNNLKGKQKIFLNIFLIIVLGLFFYKFFISYNESNIKLYSLYARFYLWKSVFLGNFLSIKSFFIGNGFDSIYLLFNQIRDPMLSLYEDKNFIADSSHNVFIDFFFFIGIIGFIFIFIPIFKILKGNIDSYCSHSIILFFLFFSFNVPVLSHFIILVFCLAVLYLENKKIGTN